MNKIQILTQKINTNTSLTKEEQQLLIQILKHYNSTKELNTKEDFSIRESMRLSGNVCPTCGK